MRNAHVNRFLKITYMLKDTSKVSFHIPNYQYSPLDKVMMILAHDGKECKIIGGKIERLNKATFHFKNIMLKGKGNYTYSVKVLKYNGESYTIIKDKELEVI